MNNVKVEFTEKNLTGNAGLIHYGKFIKKLGLTQAIEEKLGIKRAENAQYTVSTVIIMMIMGVLAGAKHMSHVAMLRVDNVIRKIFGWTIFPVASTLGRIFKLFSWANCDEIAQAEDVVRRKVWSKKWFGKIILDLDSSVKGVFGNQEGVENGYNPKKKGQKSYHPLFCFVAETYECLHSWFRCGSAYSANGVVEFMKECLGRIPKRVWKIIVRGDSAFFNGALFDLLESNSIGYVIKVKMKNLQELLEKQTWQKVKNMNGVEIAEFEYECKGWKRRRRFVVVRILIGQLTGSSLFPDFSEPEYEYFCYVTNMKLSPWGTHKFYGKRAASENWIDWCKNQMAGGNILTNDFWANSAIFQTCILAYNLTVWMFWLNTKKGFHEEPNTIRMFLIRVPGRLLTSGRKLLLKLEKDFYFKRRWIEIDEGLDCINFD